MPAMPRFIAPLLAALATALSLPALAQGSVYRCTDAHGKVAYQSQPCADSQTTRRVELDTRFVGGQPAARPSEPPATEPGEPGKNGDGPPEAPPAPAPPPAPSRVKLPAPTAQEAATWGKGTDVIVVSGYQASSQQTAVNITHPTRPVLLVLSSYLPVQWRVLPTPGTRIKAVLVSSYQQRSSVQAPPDVPVAQDELPHAIETPNVNFRQLLSKLNARYGVQAAVAFSGDYTLPGVVTVKGPYPADPYLTMEGVRPEAPRLPLAFDLVSTDGRRIAWTNAGPADGKPQQPPLRSSGGTQAVALRGDGQEAFALHGNGGELRWYPRGLAGGWTPLPLPRELPPLSWGNGLALDPATGILAIVSFGGEGHFYRYDTRKRSWLGARSLQDRDLMGLAFNPDTGGYVSMSNAAELVFFNGQGQLESVRSVAKLLPDLDSTYDRHNSRIEGLSVVARGKAVAILRMVKGAVTHIWTYEVATNRAQLTFKAPE